MWGRLWQHNVLPVSLGRAGLVLCWLAIPLLPNDSLELRQEMWCHAREEAAQLRLPPRSERENEESKGMITGWFALMSVTLNYRVGKE